MRSHTGGGISVGGGVLHKKASVQRLNTKSSTEAGLFGVSGYLPYNLWLWNCFHSQGYEIMNNIVYQDNQIAIKMDNNGGNSCTGNSRHINIGFSRIE